MATLRRRFAVARATVGLGVVVLVLAAALGLVVAAPPRSVTTTVMHTSTETLTSTSISVSTQTTTTATTVTSVSTQTDIQTLPPQCFGNSISEGGFDKLSVGASSPAIVCVQLYDFNATSAIALNTVSIVNVEGFTSAGGEQFSGSSNFTIAASTTSIDIGGPTNANEGVVVALSITAKPGASGTYFVMLQQGTQQALYLTDNGSGGEKNGGGIGRLVTGSGQPDYTAGVTTLALSISCTSSFTIQGVPYNLCPNLLYYRITGATNSTQ